MENAFCKVEITVVNDLAKATGDAEGFLKLTVSKKDTKEVVATRYQKIRLTAGKRQVVPQAFVIESRTLGYRESLSLRSEGTVESYINWWNTYVSGQPPGFDGTGRLRG